MKTVTPLVVALVTGLSLTLPRSAAAFEGTVRLVGGPGAAYQAGAGPYVFGRVLLDGERWGMEAGAREGAIGVLGDIGNPGLDRSNGLFVGAIQVMVRKPVGPVVVRGGFAHHHETPAPAVKDAPVQTTAGIHESIVHRSGMEVGVETALPLPRVVPSTPFTDRLDFLVGVAADWMPDAGGNPVTAWLDLGLRIKVGA